MGEPLHLSLSLPWSSFTIVPDNAAGRSKSCMEFKDCSEKQYEDLRRTQSYERWQSAGTMETTAAAVRARVQAPRPPQRVAPTVKRSQTTPSTRSSRSSSSSSSSSSSRNATWDNLALPPKLPPRRKSTESMAGPPKLPQRRSSFNKRRDEEERPQEEGPQGEEEEVICFQLAPTGTLSDSSSSLLHQRVTAQTA